MMFKKILVPVDFSKVNQKALEMAVDIASRNHGNIDLLHVIEIIAHTTFAEFREFYQNLEKRAHRHMEQWIALYQDRPVTIDQHVIYGHRVQEILAFAQKNETDLILLNSHKFNPKNAPQAWSAISHKIGILSRCPVLLVK
jgi:nucleotide-binding universal stress UspA family protein